MYFSYILFLVLKFFICTFCFFLINLAKDWSIFKIFTKIWLLTLLFLSVVCFCVYFIIFCFYPFKFTLIFLSWMLSWYFLPLFFLNISFKVINNLSIILALWHKLTHRHVTNSAFMSKPHPCNSHPLAILDADCSIIYSQEDRPKKAVQFRPWK